MKTIKKKILPKYFGAVVTGAKQFELRKDDDDIQVGDELELIEWDGEPTGKVVRCDVTYVLRNCVEYGLMDGYCIVGISTPTVDAVEVVMNRERAINILRGAVLGTNEQTHEAVFTAIKALKEQERVDAVEVVRCKDCKWYEESIYPELQPTRFCYRLKNNKGVHIGYNWDGNDFCSYGERREER